MTESPGTARRRSAPRPGKPRSLTQTGAGHDDASGGGAGEVTGAGTRSAPERGDAGEGHVGSDADSHERSGAGRKRNIRVLPTSGQVPIEDLYRGRTRLALLRDLAMGEWSPREIALQVGCTEEAIRAFQGDHQDEISEVRAALAGHLAIETAGLWVTKKQNRLAEFQADIEDLDLIITAMRRQGVSSAEDAILGGLGTRRHHNLMKTKLALYKAVADELHPRTGINLTVGSEEDDSNTVRYVIEASEFTEDLT